MSLTYATLRFLAEHDLRTVKTFLQGRGRTLKEVLTATSLAEPSLNPDSQEAMEETELSEARAERAIAKWEKLDRAEQAVLLKAIEELGGDPQDLVEEIDLRRPI